MSKVVRKEEKISPALAKLYLEKNTGNFRQMQHGRVVRYASDMTAGRWMMNDEAIKLSDDGILLDGQHRLAAIVLSGVTITCLVSHGLPASTAITMDKGMPRSLASWLRHESIANSSNIATIARNCVHASKGLWGRVAVGADGCSDDEIIQYVESHHDTLQSALKIARPTGKFVNSSLMSSILHIAAGKRLAEELDLCVWFCNALAKGELLTESQPVFQLRRQMTVSHYQQKVSIYIQKGLATIAWNKTVRGESCKNLQFRISGDNPMSIPDVLSCPVNESQRGRAAC